jgi:protein TonB
MPGAPTDRSPSGESAARLPSPNVAPSASGQPALLPPTPEQPAGNDATGQTGPPFVPLGSLRFTKFVEPTERYGLIARSNTPGWVLVTFRVDTAGRTSGIEVLEAEPKGRYESEAISAVRRWRFEPFMEDGKPVERQTRVRIRFERK